jgi:DNA-binding NtrC family response regulator
VGSANVLIVDDEESLAFFLQQSLLGRNKGWRVEIAGSAEEALVKLGRCRYEVVVADLRMSGINGLELVAAVRSIDPGTRVILMTAYGSEEIEAEARRLQVYGYVTKPFKMERMRALVRSAVGELAARRGGDVVVAEGGGEDFFSSATGVADESTARSPSPTSKPTMQKEQ